MPIQVPVRAARSVADAGPPAADGALGLAIVNSDGPDLLEMFFVALVLVAIAYSFTH